jgi:hypothetical protein
MNDDTPSMLAIRYLADGVNAHGTLETIKHLALEHVRSITVTDEASRAEILQAVARINSYGSIQSLTAHSRRRRFKADRAARFHSSAT